MSTIGDSSELDLISQLKGFLRDNTPRRPSRGTVTRVGLKAVNLHLTDSGTHLQDVDVIGGTTGLAPGSTLYLLHFGDDQVVALNPTGNALGRLQTKIDAIAPPTGPARPPLLPYSTAATSSPPTPAELNSAFGAQPAGWLGLLNSGGAGISEYLVSSDGLDLWYTAMTKGSTYVGHGATPGDLIWEIDTGVTARPFAITVHGGDLYIGGINGSSGYGFRLEKRSIADGSADWIIAPTAYPSYAYDWGVQDMVGLGTNIYVCGPLTGGSNNFIAKIACASGLFTSGTAHAGGYVPIASLTTDGTYLYGTQFGGSTPAQNRTIVKLNTSLTGLAYSSGTFPNLYSEGMIRWNPGTSKLILRCERVIDTGLGFVSSKGSINYNYKIFCIDSGGRIFTQHDHTDNHITELATDLSSNLWDVAVTHPPWGLSSTLTQQLMCVGPSRVYTGGQYMSMSGVDLTSHTETLAVVTAGAVSTDVVVSMCYDSGFVYLASVRGGVWVVQKRVA